MERVRRDVDPRAMPLTGLANAAIDRIAPDKEFRRRPRLRRKRPHLLSRRGTGSAGRAAGGELGRCWPGRGGATTSISPASTGVIHVAQPEANGAQAGHAVASLDPFQLAGLSPLVTIGGSLVAALAVLEEAMPAEAAWEAVSLDDRWQLEQWGDDPKRGRRWMRARRDFLPPRGSSNYCS